MRVKAIPVSLSCLLPLALCAQTPCNLTLHGRVVDEHDGSPLDFTSVVIPGTAHAATADDQGRFTLEGLCPRSYTLRFSHIGCLPREQRVQLPHADTLVLYLEHHALELADVEVVAKRPDDHVGQSHTTLDRAAMELQDGTGLAGLIGDIPGVQVLRTGPTIGKPMIHGLGGNRVLVLNQGVRQEDQQWGSEHAPNLDPLSSDRITVVKGAAGVQYGADAIGGVVITEPVELPVSPGLRGEVQLQGSSNGRGGGAGGLLEGGVKGVDGLGWRVQGSGLLLGDQQSPEYVLSNTGTRDGGGSAAIGWRTPRQGIQLYYSLYLRELGILRAAHIGNVDDLQRAIATGEPWYTAPFTHAIEAPRQTVSHQLGKAKAYRFLGGRNRLEATYAFQLDERREYDVRRGGRSDIPALDLHLATHTGEGVFKHFIGERLHGKAGINALYQENLNVPGTGVRPLIPNYRKRNGGVFAVEHLDLGANLELEAGARLEATRLEVYKYTLAGGFITPVHAYTDHALSFGLNWGIRDSLRLRANIGTAFRPPQVSELYSEGLHHGTAAIEVGDPGLGSEHAVKASAELEAYALHGRLRLNLSGHGSRLGGFIQLQPDGFQLTIRGAFPVFRYTATDAWIYGLDGEAEWNFLPHWALRPRLSLVRGRDLQAHAWLYQMPADRLANSLIFRIPEAGRWHALECSLTATVVFHQSRAPMGIDFMEPPRGYHLLGLSAGVGRSLGHGELRLGLEGSNLLNAAYRDYLDAFRYYADARGTDVSVWVRYSFGGKARPPHGE